MACPENCWVFVFPVGCLDLHSVLTSWECLCSCWVFVFPVGCLDLQLGFCLFRLREGACVLVGCLWSLLGAWTCSRSCFIGSDFVRILVFVFLVGCLDLQSTPSASTQQETQAPSRAQAPSRRVNQKIRTDPKPKHSTRKTSTLKNTSTRPAA